MAIEKTYQYKVSRNGTYLGMLPEPTNDFEYTQDINTAGAEAQITIPLHVDIAGEPVEPIETESGEVMQTENEQVITTEGATQILGTKDSGLLIANGNEIEVYEISNDYPNGVLVFKGFQQDADVDFEEGLVTLTIVSNGKDLADYVYGNVSTVLQLSQTLTGYDFGFWATRRYGQTFVTTGSQTDIRIIRLRLTAALGGSPRTYTVKVWTDSASATISGTPLGSATVVVTDPAWTEVDFAFATPITVTPSTSYFFSLEVDSGAIAADINTWGAFDAHTGADGYASGTIGFSGNSGGPWSFSTPNATGDDFWFKIYSGTLVTNAAFTATDPADMVRDAIDGYQSQGGIVTYTAPSIDDTGYSLNYEFITATVLEIIEKARELSPSNWYWYVDPATEVLYFKETLSTATHTFLLGKHITGLQLRSTIKYIKNVTYFTGGPTAGVNFLKVYTNQQSLNTDRVGLQKLVDNRILAADEPSAAALSNSAMEETLGESFQTTLTISAETYDITTINIGETVAIRNTGSFVDSLTLQITSKRRMANAVVLTIGRLPFKTANYVDKIKRDLENQQTLDNPNAPS